MKNNSLTYFALLFCWLITYSNTNAQGKKNCEYNCFQSSMTRSETDANGCVQYEMEVTYSGDCESALSHYTVAIPACGSVNDISNSENWKVEMTDPDPTTGLVGFKIDDISNFGESDGPSSFKVFFTLCGDSNTCEELNCWSPTVAYKAGQCVAYDTLEVQCPKLEASLEKSNLSCFESGNGLLSVVITEGAEPFGFAWSTSDTTQRVANLGAGDYTVIITDGNGETLELSATLTQPEAILVEGLITPSDCSGANNGAVDISVTGGTGSFTYSWSNGVTTEDIADLPEGAYTVLITDASGCATSTTFSVTNQVQINITGAVTNASCSDTSGAIDITVDGGASPYTYSWSNGSVDEDLTGLDAGSYTVSVTDSNGCHASQSFNVNVLNTLTLRATVTKTGCVEDNSGAIDLRIFGGVEPYTYEWSNGATSEDIDGLAYGSYSVTVTDGAGCTRELRLFVSRDRILASVELTEPSCFGDVDGSITVTTLSGIAPYTYEWSNGATGSELTGLTSGVYTVTITDASGCTSTYSYFLNSPTEMTSSFSISSSSCGAEGSYEIDLNVGGGTAPYTYEWSNGETIEDLSDLSSGTYTVIITDANGCTTEQEVLVEASPVELACLIEPIESVIDCNSTGNLLGTLSDADSYSWTVSSSDGLWEITSDSTAADIVFVSGEEGSTAVFTLTIFQDGCEQTCSLDIQSCSSSDDDGGGDDGDNGGGGDDSDDDNGDDGNDDDGDNGDDPSCGDGYSSEISLIKLEEGCYSYEVTVNYDGNAKHGLSHYTLAIPCGQISDANNSEGWNMSIGSKDPTTGLWGIKVDDIEGFGEGDTPDSFNFNFIVCASDEECVDILDGWQAIAAYKAGQCVTYDTLSVDSQVTVVSNSISAYPNPFSSSLTIEVESVHNSYASLMIYNKEGEVVEQVFAGHLIEGSKKVFSIDSDTWPGGVYYYKLSTNGEHLTRKLLLVK